MKKIILIKILIFVFSLPLFCKGVEEDVDTIVYAWKIDEFGSSEKFELDTLLYGSFFFNPLNYSESFYAFTGNYGGPAINMIFNERLKHDNKFFGYSSYYPYFLNFENTVYYNTKTPYSEFKYGTNTGSKTKGENILSLSHTQNVNKNLNVGIDYRLVNTKGYYNNQQTNDNSFRLFSSYNSKKIDIYFSGTLNNFRILNNGGVIVDSLFLNSNTDTKNFQTKLQDARSQIKSKDLKLIANYNIGHKKIIEVEKDSLLDSVSVFVPLLRLNYRLGFEDFRYQFYDKSGDAGYYSYLVSPNSFNDTTYESAFKNSFGITLVGDKSKLFSPELSLGYSYLYHTHKQFQTSTNAFLDNRWEGEKLVDQSFYGNILSKNRFIPYLIDGEYFFDGYYKNNYDIGLTLSKPLHKKDSSLFGKAYFEYRRQLKTPMYFYNRFISNSAIWLNDFNNTQTDYFNLGYKNLKYHFELSFLYSINENYIYINNLKVPEQKEDVFYSNAISVKKDFHFWKFVSSTKYVNQMSTSGVISIPQHIVNTVLYLDQDLFFKSTGGTMNLQLGARLSYFSEYKIYAYSPNINSFYLQEDASYGNYPYIDVFLNAKIKTFRLFLEMTHINASDFNKEYFTVYPYPQNPRAFRFGVAWLFYN